MAKHEFSLSDEELDAIAERVAAKLTKPAEAPAVPEGKPTGKPADKAKKDAPKKDDKPKGDEVTRDSVLAKLGKFKAEYSMAAATAKIKVYAESFGKVADTDLAKLSADLDSPPPSDEKPSEEEF